MNIVKKQYKYLYRQVTDEKVIREAYKNMRKFKTKRREIQEIDQNLDAWVIHICQNTIIIHGMDNTF